MSVVLRSWGGRRLTLDADEAGNVVLALDDDPNILVSARELRAALTSLGVITSMEARTPRGRKHDKNLRETVQDLTERLSRLESRFESMLEANQLWDGS